jgi:hypothetical protein
MADLSDASIIDAYTAVDETAAAGAPNTPSNP